MEIDELIERHPRVFHMAEAGAWPSIAQHGLLSTTALLDHFAIPPGPEREAIESQRRPQSITLSDAVRGRAVIRDNKPLIDSRLAAILDGCTVPEYYRLLNRRVFLWAQRERLERLLVAKPYRGRTHVVIAIDTAQLVARHHKRITLSRINSGATLFGSPPRRGPATFERIADFQPRSAGNRRRNLVELAVDLSIPDVVNVAVSVDEFHPDGSVTAVWRPVEQSA